MMPTRAWRCSIFCFNWSRDESAVEEGVMKKSSRNREWNALRRHNSSTLSPPNLCSEVTASVQHATRNYRRPRMQSPHSRSFNRPLNGLLIRAHFVIPNEGRLLPRSDREVEPAARALFGLQRRSLQGRLFF